MDDQRHTRARVHARDAGLRRLKAATGALTLGTAAVAGIFTGLAASANSGKKVVAETIRTRTAAPRVREVAPQRIPPPPQLPALASVGGGDGQQPAPASQPQPPAQAPTATPQQPVAVSGGS